ncbi:MAG: hypothetical protein ACTSW3_07190 [Promethearchaeota archaeon]
MKYKSKGLMNGKKNPMWKGDKVGIISLHEWIRNHKKKVLLCESCGKGKKLELANLSGKYKRDINDYKWLCRSCHTKMDYELKNRFPKGKQLREREGEFFKCASCRKFKKKSEFYKCKPNRDGISNICKECAKLKARKYYAKKMSTL